MIKVSQDFAPPFKLIAPFFILGSFFYSISSFYLFSFDAANLSLLHPNVIAFTHLFLLGFVMMIIFGAMAQLVPVVLEVGHFSVELFYAIWPLLLIGTLLMVFGFLYLRALLPYGGVVVLISMMIFVVEIFLTIFKVQKLTLVMSSVVISNTFLFFGIIFGLLMALSYAGTISLDIFALLQAHVYAVLGGYIAITIMGLSLVLVPMFTLSHNFSLKRLEVSLSLMSFAVVLVIVASFLKLNMIAYIGYIAAIVSMAVYFSLIYKIYAIRPRKENDIYALSLMFSYLSMLASIAILTLYFILDKEVLLFCAMWLFFFGFLAFLITGHIYKIIPFLVWYEKFSPLVGKQKVPMLVDMVPKNSAQAQLVFCVTGVVVVAVAILIQNDVFLKAGASFLLVGTLAFVRNVFYMINFK